MTNNINPSIQTFPVELLHRIFDNLDVETIIFSIRPVCRLFRSVVNTYNRYVLDLKLISKSNFHILCRLINPKNVISIILSNTDRTSGQIDLFILLVRLRQFTRIRSLTLLNINEDQFSFILKRVNLNFLTSFSFNIGKYDERRIKTTSHLLTSIFALSSLRRLELDIKVERMSKISWPINCSIQYLIINKGILMDHFFTILRCSPHLHTVIVKQSFNEMINNITLTLSPPMYFRQMTSLTIEQLNVTIDRLESFLLLTPSLVYLKLISEYEKISDGKRWEQFIEINLPQLDKFEFFFNERKLNKQTREDLESIIASFQTPFWIEHKKWFVTCEYKIVHSRTVYLYSIPICKSHILYDPTSKKDSLSTYTMTTHNDLPIIDNVNSFSLSLSNSIVNDIQEKKAMTSHPLFPKVTKIDMHFFREWQLLSLQSISTFINISQIVEIKMDSYYFNEWNQNALMDISIFMEQAHNLSSLIIQSTRTVENMHSIIPRRVKHLQIQIKDVNQIKGILERCQHLSTVQLDLKYSITAEEVIKWFADNTINSTCQESYKSVAVWLGKKKIQSTEIKLDHKRIKLTEDS